jgi:LacI family transcriptional regulator
MTFDPSDMTDRPDTGAPSGPSLNDVARLAGVSVATASRVLTRSRPVRPDLRDRVLASAAKLDYAPNPHARALAQSHDASVGVIVHDISDPYFSEIVRGALEQAQSGGRMLLICNTYRDIERELEYIRHFRAQRVHAVLLAGSGRVEREVGARISAEVLGFERSGGRAALIGRHEATGDTVLPDNVGGARQIARHLFELGHRRIGVVAGPNTLTTTHDRLQGFLGQLSELGVELPESHVCWGSFDRQSGELAADELVERIPGLTAIFALNDVMAIGALAGLQRQGLRVPEDMSVAGFDDIPFAQDIRPGLTTVRVPMLELGRRAFSLAFDPRPAGFRVELLETELVVRGSTAPPPA